MIPKNCPVVYRANTEKLFVWNGETKRWKWFKAVSGGGRGLVGPKIRGPGNHYGDRDERESNSRFANLGGPSLFKDKKGHPISGDTIYYGTLPNGVYQVGNKIHHPTLKWAMPLTTVSGVKFGRGGFYIHGQGRYGSAGCIVPVDGRLTDVFQAIAKLQKMAPVYLAVEGNVTKDLPDTLALAAHTA